MFAKKHWIPMILFIVALTACGSGSRETQSGQGNLNPDIFAAIANSGVSVDLSWASVADTMGYLLEAKYGSGEFFEVAQLPADTTTFRHFIVPNSKKLTYRLSSMVAAGNEPIGTASVSIPELSPNPIVITQVQPFAPVVSGGAADLLAMPTIDPLNPDPNAMATMVAMATGMSNFNPEDFLPEMTPVSVAQAVGLEGGTISLTDPNGVVYLLEVPAGLLKSETTFSLDPIKSIAELPFSQLLGAVQIFPPIPFNDPLRLTIMLPTASDGKIVAFLGSTSNQEFSMVPVYQNGTVFTMNVYWGDIVGIAASNQEEVLAQGSRIPTDSADQISQQIAIQQALSDDQSPESFANIMRQIFEGIFLIDEQTGILSNGISGVSAAPALQEGSQSGVALWGEINALQRAWMEEQANPLYNRETNPLAENLSHPGARAAKIVEINTKIKNFLDTHTGCRTRDEMYAEALLQILLHPENKFQEDISTNFQSRFGNPETLKDCTFRLHVTQSTQTIEDQGSRSLVRAHVNPFPLEVVVRGDKISFRGVGIVTYDEWKYLWKACPPQFDVRPPETPLMWVTNLSPIFNEELKVIGLQLLGVAPDPFSSLDPGLSASFIDPRADSCKLRSVMFSKPMWDIWTTGVAGLHNPIVNYDNWGIVGEDSYVATNTISGYTQANITEDMTMVLTVSQK